MIVTVYLQMPLYISATVDPYA